MEPTVATEIVVPELPVGKAVGGKARMRALSPSQKSTLAKQGAAARWGKKSQKLVKVKSKKSAALPGRQIAGVFGIALMAAEKRLAKAIQERALAASSWAVLNAEIPSLQRTIFALRNQQNPLPVVDNQASQIMPDGSVGLPANYDLASVVSDTTIPIPTDAGSYYPQPKPQAPAQPTIRAARAGGGAVGVDLAEPEDEDRFLRESPAAGGEWH